MAGSAMAAALPSGVDCVVAGVVLEGVCCAATRLDARAGATPISPKRTTARTSSHLLRLLFMRAPLSESGSSLNWVGRPNRSCLGWGPLDASAGAPRLTRTLDAARCIAGTRKETKLHLRRRGVPHVPHDPLLRTCRAEPSDGFR